jgi:ribonuclease HII
MLKEFYDGRAIEAGCDEAGRGCLAGPVYAAAAVLPAGFSHPLLDDSKKMTARGRDTLRAVIEREAVAWAVAAVSAARIDRVNILNASFEAMTLAVRGVMGGAKVAAECAGRMARLRFEDGVADVAAESTHDEADERTEAEAADALVVAGGRAVCPGLLLIDGNRFRTSLKIPYVCVVGGDGLYASIAAASVLAKTHRDDYMERLAADYPEYGWRGNKGYPTRAHRDAIAAHGLSPHHRTTFRSGAGEQRLF